MPFVRFATIATSLSLLAVPAHALLFRSYLSVNGNDSNPCTLQQPCRLLPAALGAVQSGGEIWMLDSANYNTATVVVDKSVTILAIPGALGSVIASGGAAIQVSTPGPVTLRNLNVLPLPGQEIHTGVAKLNAGSITILDCNFSGFSEGTGVFLSGGADGTILHSVFRANSQAVQVANSSVGIVESNFIDHGSFAVVALSSADQAANVTITRSSFRSAGQGGVWVQADSTAASRLDISDTRLEGKQGAGTGVRAAAAVFATLTRNAIIGYDIGLQASGTDTRAVIANNVVTRNNVGIAVPSGTVESTGGNTVRNNATADVIGVVTAVGSL
jgi:hypothetical protein